MKNQAANTLKAAESWSLLIPPYINIHKAFVREQFAPKLYSKLNLPHFPLTAMSTEALVTDYKPHNSSRVPQRGKNSTQCQITGSLWWQWALKSTDNRSKTQRVSTGHVWAHSYFSFVFMLAWPSECLAFNCFGTGQNYSTLWNSRMAGWTKTVVNSKCVKLQIWVCYSFSYRATVFIV